MRSEETHFKQWLCLFSRGVILGGFTGDRQKSDWKKSIIILLKINLQNTQSQTLQMAAGTGGWHGSAHTALQRSGRAGLVPFLPGPLVPTHRLSVTCGLAHGEPAGPRSNHEALRPEAAQPHRPAWPRPGPSHPTVEGPTPPQPVLTSWCAGIRR